MLLLTKRARTGVEDKLKKYFDAPAVATPASRGHAPSRREKMEAGVPPLPSHRSGKESWGGGFPFHHHLPRCRPGEGWKSPLQVNRFPSLSARGTVRTLTDEQESGTDTRTPTPGLRTRLKTCVRVHGRCWRRSHPLPPISTPPSASTHIPFSNVRVNYEPHNGGALRPRNGGVVGPRGGSRQLGSDAALLRSLLPRIRYSPASYGDYLLWVSSSAAAAAGRRRRVPPGDGYCVLPGCPAAAAAIAAGGCLRKFALL